VTRLALSRIRARPLRTALCAISVLLGVTLVAGTLIFTDTLHRALRDTTAAATRGADVVVSGRTEGGLQPPTVPRRVLDRIEQLPDVQRAAGEVSDTGAIVGRGGRALDLAGGHTRAISYLGPPFQTLRIVAGRAPRGPGEVAIDQDTARLEHFRLGQGVTVATELPQRQFNLVGLLRLGGAVRADAAIVSFDLPTAEALFLKGRAVDRVVVAGRPGVPPSRLAAEIAPLLGGGLVVRTATAQIDYEVRQLFDELSFVEQVLLGVGAIALLAGALVIFNAFSVAVTGRATELGLLRALGARRRQLLRSTLVEAVAIGLVASVAGLGLGLAVAAAIHGAIDAAGWRLPTAGPVVSPSTIAISLGLGLLCSGLAALAPALRTMRVTPIDALRGYAELPASTLAPALPWIALGFGAVGIAISVHGLIAGSGVVLAVIGAFAIVAALALLAPRLVPRAAGLAGLALARAGDPTGRMAGENARRSPARTGAAASAVIIGVAVVAFVAILATEARSSVRNAVARSYAGDIAITARDGTSPIPAAAAQTVAAVPGVEVASVLRRSQAQVAGIRAETANGIDTQTIGAVYRFDWTAGDDSLIGLLGPNGALVERSMAQRDDLRVGSHFIAVTPAGRSTELTVRGIYRDAGLLPGFSVGMPSFNDLFHQPRARRILVKVAAGVDPTAVQRLVEDSLRAFPQAAARSEPQLAAAEAGRYDGLGYLLYALVAMTALVAGIGILNSLALELHERTREIGLFRAMGMSRRAVRRMVAFEGLITAAVGGVLGLAIGTVVALVVTESLNGAGLELGLPWLTLLGTFLAALAIGCTGAVLPARRAARIDVLRAIAYE
jgi:putative ABC transport system permease protein